MYDTSDSLDSYWNDTGASAITPFSQLDDKVKSQSARFRSDSQPSAKPTVGTKSLESSELPPISSTFLFTALPESDNDCFIPTKQWLCWKCHQKIPFPLRPNDAPSTCISEGAYDFCGEVCWRAAIELAVRNTSPFLNEQLMVTDMSYLTQNSKTANAILPLHAFVSSASMKLILKCALATRNGCLITKVVLFIKQRCDQQNFRNLLVENPMALDHYLVFLRETGQIGKAQDLQQRLFRRADGLMLKYRDMKAQFSHSQPDTILKRLQSFMKEHLEDAEELSLEKNLVQEHIELLQVQKRMKDRGDVERLQKTVDSRVPDSLHQLSLVETVYYYVQLYDFKQTNATFCELFKIQNQVSFAWMCARAFVEKDDWNGLHEIVTQKKWYSRNRPQYLLPPKRLLFFLVVYGVSDQIFEKFLRLIPDLEQLCDTAIQLRKGRFAVMECVFQKNKKQLETILPRLEKDDRKLADSHLQISMTKWPTRT